MVAATIARVARGDDEAVHEVEVLAARREKPCVGASARPRSSPVCGIFSGAPVDGVDAVSQLHDLAFQNAQARAARRLLAPFEEHLQAETDAQVGPTRGEVSADGVADPVGHRPGAVTETALARHDELVCAARRATIARDLDFRAASGLFARLEERSLHAAQVSESHVAHHNAHASLLTTWAVSCLARSKKDPLFRGPRHGTSIPDR